MGGILRAAKQLQRWFAALKGKDIDKLSSKVDLAAMHKKAKRAVGKRFR